VSGDRLKGIYITITDQVSGYKCVIPNSDTRGCSCPGSAYSSKYSYLSGTLIAQYDDQRCGGGKNDHFYSNYRRLYACQ
ncbi:pilus assembly protein PilV, partial [Salmonella enterica subsp. enterica serovar Enteritidis]|nr:pilus assembly protein PilV [Salmonella enterica subsp. enterica serovar Enteritidis]